MNTTAVPRRSILERIVTKVLSYPERLATWMRLLEAVKGYTVADSLRLYGSALAGIVTSLRKLGFYRAPVLLGDMVLTEKRTGSFALRQGTDDVLHIMWWREPGVFRLLERTLRPGDVFVDAGSNIGFYSLLASRLVGPAGQVHAFEMMPDTAQRLRRNIDLSAAGNITVHQVALSDVSGEVVRASYNPEFLGQASLSSDLGARRTHTVEVKTSRFDDILAAIGPIRLMKIDLEGAELNALKGGVAMLRNVDAIVFENTTKDPSIDAFLVEQGFVIEHLEHDDYVARKPAGGSAA